MELKKQGMLMSVLSVTVAIILLGYSAYGWFSMNKDITAFGENVEITAPSNLEISLDGNNWKQVVEVDLKQVVQNDVAGFDKDNDQFYLLPASSVNGTDGTFWETDKKAGVVTNINEVNFGSGVPIRWHNSTSSYEGHFIDFPLYFRTSSQTPINEVTLTGDSAITEVGSLTSTNIDKTVRVAFLTEDKTAPSVGTAPLVYAHDNASTSTRSVVSKVGDDLQLVDPVYIRANSEATLFTLQGINYNGAAEYNPKRITVRIWVEGQDSYCVASMGGKKFSVKLTFGIKENG